ncbi:MAG: hypothetical protein WC341_15215 [Bacteroidales bacterium]|jgi:glyceraldehyde-3-phosphate dehydrogenase (NAD(P))
MLKKDAFQTSTHVALINYGDGLSNNAIKELMLALNRPCGDMYEVALWQDMLKIEGDELFYDYEVDNQAIVIPETIDVIRALTGLEKNPQNSIQKTNKSLVIRQKF